MAAIPATISAASYSSPFCSLKAALLWHRGCYREIVIDIALSIVALIAGGLALELYTAAWSFPGPQDEHGFHLGSEAYHYAK